MKKFFLKIALFLAVMIAIDLAFGKVCDFLRVHTKGGFTGNVQYICEQCDEDIIMMGSSRMRHHYVPQVFEDSLGMRCYNTGIDGNGIILSYGFLEMILERYTPRLILYDVSSFDMYEDDNTKYLGTLKAYYDRSGIPDIFQDVDPAERLKMKSRLYRYNSNLLGLAGDYVHPLQQFEKGYWPLQNVMDYEPEKPQTEDYQVDSLKLRYLKKFITLARSHGATLVFTASPTYWGEQMGSYYAPVETIFEAEGIPFINYIYDPEICGSKEYWSDATHLNDVGADLYSRQLCQIFNSRYVFN